jgi:hypothetical protein
MEAFIRYVVGELKEIARTPLTFITASLVIAAAIWWAMDWRYSGIIDNLKSDLEIARDQRDDYKNKLSGATPDQVVRKIADLEKRIGEIEPHPPRILTDEQKQKLTDALSPLAKDIGAIQVYADSSTEPMHFSREFMALFRRIGIAPVGPQPSYADSSQRGVFVGLVDPDNPSALAKKFIEALKTGVDVQTTKWGGDDWKPPTVPGHDFDLFVSLN